MKQKLLTLATLLLCAVSGAWATTTTVSLVSYTVTDNKATIVNEDVTVVLTRTSGTLPSPASSSRGFRWQTKCVVTATIPSGNIIKSVKLTCGKNGNSVGSITYTLTDGTSAITGTWDNALNGSKKDDYTWTAGGSTKTNNWVLTNTGSTGDLYISAVTVEYVADKTIATQAFAGVKKGSTELTEGTDYTISSTTITLAEAYKAATAPTDVKLINHITYTDSSEGYQDVDVTLAKDGDFFQGTATIGLTTYTVKVPVDNTPTLEADKNAVTITSTKAAVETATINLTGANLTGATSVAFASDVEGLTVSPAAITLTDGYVDQTFTVSYHSMSAVAATNVNLTFTVGTKSLVIPITYSSTAADVTTITDVTAATTWDWSNTSKDVNSPANGYEIPVANATDLSGFPTGFNYGALAANAQYFARKSEKCFQGTTLKFHTAEAGYITVVFSNTGGDRPYRHLFVNGVDTGKKSNTAKSTVTAENISVEAGDVELKGMMEDGDNNPTTPNMLRIYKVVFVPSDPAPSVNISDKEWATYVTETAIDFTSQTNVEAFIVTGHEGTAITKTKVTSVPANTPVLLHALNGGGSYYSFDTRATSSTDVSGNKLKKGANGIAPESGKTKYVLSVDGEGNAAFKRITASADIPATKAYLQFDETIEAPLFDLDGETTSIKAVETKTVENGEYINLAGQRVAQPTKGLYIVNGKKVIIK